MESLIFPMKRVGWLLAPRQFNNVHFRDLLWKFRRNLFSIILGYRLILRTFKSMGLRTEEHADELILIYCHQVIYFEDSLFIQLIRQLPFQFCDNNHSQGVV